jgi:glycerol-3-phosphate dehydrogenase (NAD(P)+)
MTRVAVLGAGSWGTALACHLARSGHRVRLWGRDGALLAEMRESGENRVYLPGVRIPAGLTATSQLEEALDGAGFVVWAVPSHGLRAVARQARPLLPAGVILVSATKGLEVESFRRMSEVLREEAGEAHPVAVVSGPSFALEVARQLPTALSVACQDLVTAAAVQQEFRGPTLRLYVTSDVIGVEIGAALKNVIAIAAGVVEGLALGHNAMAALITRGLAEITRLACVEGARPETLAGLSGLGDLVLTCTGDLSRNRQVGIELGRGRSIDDILSGMRMVAEGVRTTHAAVSLAARCGIELPIASQMAAVLDGRTPPLGAVEQLMLRPPKAELDIRS